MPSSWTISFFFLRCFTLMYTQWWRSWVKWARPCVQRTCSRHTFSHLNQKCILNIHFQQTITKKLYCHTWNILQQIIVPPKIIIMLRHFISLPWMLIPAPDQMMYAACKRLGHVPYGAGLQSRWTPGTEREVINMVTHLKIKSDLKERERERSED